MLKSRFMAVALSMVIIAGAGAELPLAGAARADATVESAANSSGSGPTPSVGALVSGNRPPAENGSQIEKASGCPASSQLVSAWRKHRGVMVTNAHITGFAHIACWRNWVIALPIALPEGNGLFEFSKTPILHGLTATELTQFNRQVCANAIARKKWSVPGMC